MFKNHGENHDENHGENHDENHRLTLRLISINISAEREAKTKWSVPYSSSGGTTRVTDLEPANTING